MAINAMASYRRLDLAKARKQLQANAELFHRKQDPNIIELVDIQDYSLRTPIIYEVNSDDYLRILDTVTDVATKLEIQLNVLGPQQKQIQFDKKITEIALDLFPMTPHEASSREVWSYITLRVLPEFASWRFPNRSSDPEWERFIGLERNTFRRLWWRAHMLGPELAVLLQEDDLVQMFERTESIGSNKHLMQSLVRFTLQNEEALRELGGKSSMIYTETAKSLRRSMAIVAYEAMTPSELESFVHAKALETLNRIHDLKDR